MTKKIVRSFNKDYLTELLERDGAILIEVPERLNSTVRIFFQCKCRNTHNKLFSEISYYGGAFCIECRKKNTAQKTKDTCIKRYGVDNPSCVQEIKDKRDATYIKNFGMHPKKTEAVQSKYRNTCMIKYNVDNASKVPEIKEKIKETFNERYDGHPMYNEVIKEKIKETCLERYGGHPMQNDTIKEKIKETCLERYGGHPMQNDDIKDKIAETCMKRYGCYPTQTQQVKDKIIGTNLDRYGVEHGVQAQEVKEKIIETNLERYGVKNPQQSKEIQEKTQRSAKKFKSYIMPSGEIRKVQGYEPFALDILVKTYTEDQIKSNRYDVPRIPYESNKKQRYYFPDIYLPHINLIIEVKSLWTYRKDEAINKMKSEAVLSQGYQFEFWIFNSKGTRI